MTKGADLPDIYKDNWNKAEFDPELFISTYISPDIRKPTKPTSEQLRFMLSAISGDYDDCWFAGGNSSGKTWTAKFMATHWASYKIRPGKPTFNSYQDYIDTPYNVLCTGPENKQAIELWSSIEDAFNKSPILKFNVKEILTGSKRNLHPFIRLNNGSLIEAIGLHDRGKHIEGQAYDLVLINEPADARNLIHCFERVLVPRTWRRGGLICGFGTPKGKGEYYELWRRGQRAIDGRFHKFWEPRVYSQYSDSRTNPYADQDKIMRGMVGRHDDYIKERIEGKFTDSVYSAFKDSDVDACISNDLKPVIMPSTGHQYVHGLDFGRKGDYTCCVTWDVSVKPHIQVNVYRAGGGAVTWENIFEDIIAIYKKYGGEFFVDATGMGGDMQQTWLDDLGVAYTPYQFGGSPAKKVSLINNLQDYIGRHSFRMAPNDELLSEVRGYPANLDDKGLDTDMVMALALCAWGANIYGAGSAVEYYNR